MTCLHSLSIERDSKAHDIRSSNVLYYIAFGKVLLFGCKDASRTVGDTVDLEADRNHRLLIIGEDEGVRSEAKAAGLSVQGDNVLTIEGSGADLSKLPILETTVVGVDQEVDVAKPSASIPDEQAYFLAKKDFGLPNFGQPNPGQTVVTFLLALLTMEYPRFMGISYDK